MDKKKSPVVKIPAGKISITCATLSYLIETLIGMGFSLNDLKNVEFELNYDGCYYESDRPSIVAIWYDIVE